MSELTIPPILQAENLSFSYSLKPVFTNISLTLFKSCRIGLTGANGSGKTTLFRCLTGLEKISSGKIALNGKQISSNDDFKLLRRHIGYALQNPEDQLFFPSILEDISFGPLNLGLSSEDAKAIALETLDFIGLKGYENRLFYQLSGGEQRLAALACVLAMRPSVLLLDEPLNGLDEKTMLHLQTSLGRLNCAMIIISHNQKFLKEMCNFIFKLEDGNLKQIS